MPVSEAARALIEQFNNAPDEATRKQLRVKLADWFLETKSDEDARAVEAVLLRETDNSPRPEDGDQALAVPPPEESFASDDGEGST